VRIVIVARRTQNVQAGPPASPPAPPVSFLLRNCLRNPRGRRPRRRRSRRGTWSGNDNRRQGVIRIFRAAFARNDLHPGCRSPGGERSWEPRMDEPRIMQMTRRCPIDENHAGSHLRSSASSSEAHSRAREPTAASDSIEFNGVLLAFARSFAAELPS